MSQPNRAKLTKGYVERIKPGEKDARLRFRALCWPNTAGEPVCPVCGGLDHYTLGTVGKWKCKGCKVQFSPTSHTVFKSHKLSYRQLLVVVANFANGVNGVAACQMQRTMNVWYKSAFVLLHKIREIMGADEAAARLGGVVEIDGAVFGREWSACRTTARRAGGCSTSTRPRRGSASG